MTSHTAFGWLSGAMPNGRLNGEPFASGITPVSDTPESLTETLLAVSSLPATALSNGVALNIGFDAATDQTAALDRFEYYVKGYFGTGAFPPSTPVGKNKSAGIDATSAAKSSGAARSARFAATAGGVEIQFNMMGREALLKALEHPDPEVLVRVSGYTAYFKDLNEKMKQEIIARTQYGFAEGQVIPLTSSQKEQAETGAEE
jgi:formate C-acetyltransferase